VNVRAALVNSATHIVASLTVVDSANIPDIPGYWVVVDEAGQAQKDYIYTPYGIENPAGGGTFSAPVPVRTLEDARVEKLAAINTYAADLRRTVRQAAQPYATEEEMTSWPIKRAEALAYQVSLAAADAPTLAIEAAARNVSLNEIANRVSANAMYLTSMEATISGVAGKHRDAVNALADVASVDAYDYSADWPA
jgi:hypothetical protein